MPGSAPFITSTYVSSNGTTIGLVFNEALSATTAVPNDFTVKNNGISNQVTAVVVSGSIPAYLPIMLEKRQLFF